LSQIFSGFLEGFWGVFAGFLAGFWLADFWPLGIFGTQKICLGSFCVLKNFFFSGFGGGKNFFFASVYSLNPLFFGLRTHKTHFKGYFRHFVTFLVVVLLL
jgi:hypothetical protein